MATGDDDPQPRPIVLARAHRETPHLILRAPRVILHDKRRSRRLGQLGEPEWRAGLDLGRTGWDCASGGLAENGLAYAHGAVHTRVRWPGGAMTLCRRRE